MHRLSASLRRVQSRFHVAPRALIMIGAVAATFAAAATATTVAPVSAEASSGLHYQRGYSLQHGWYCYGWADGAYHCTHQWGRAHNGVLVSYTTWVPNYSAPVHISTAVASQQSAPVKAPKATIGAYNPGQAAIISEIRGVFGPYATQALAVARCESGLNPSARNPQLIGRAHAAGVFQILDNSTWYTTSYKWASPYNANANIRAAYQIFHRDGNSWREWSCKP